MVFPFLSLEYSIFIIQMPFEGPYTVVMAVILVL